MISVAEFLVILIVAFVMFLVLALAAWILVNRSKIRDSGRRQAELDALDREYASGELDEDEYKRRRERIMNERMS